MRTPLVALLILASALTAGSALASIAPPHATDLIDEQMVRALAGYTGALVARPQEPSAPGFNDIEYHPAGKDDNDDSLDVGVKLWLRNDTIYVKLLNCLTGGIKELSGLGKRAITVEEADERGVVFDDGHGLVVLVRCGHAQCKTMDAVVALAHRVAARIPAGW